MNIILSMTLSGSIVFIVYSLFEHIKFFHFSPQNRYFILKAILFFHFIPLGYLTRKLTKSVLARFGLAYKDTFINGSKPVILFVPNEQYINVAYRNHTLIISIWIFISILIFLRAILLRNKLRNLILHASQEITSDTVLQTLAKCQVRLNITKKIQIYTTSADISAFTYGLFHPLIVIPQKYSAKELELMLLHELVHIKRGDSFVMLLRTVALGIYWFNPLIYPIYKKINTLCELACDELVVNNIEKYDKRNYSNLIIEAANKQHIISQHITPLGKNSKIIKDRIDIIMIEQNKKGRQQPITLILSIGILLTSIVPTFAYEPPNELTMLDNNNAEELLVSVSSGNFAEFTTDDFLDPTTLLPVSKIQYDSQFTDKNNTIYPIDTPSGQFDCNHSYIEGIFTTHIKNNTNDCIVNYYDAKYCTKCNLITDKVLTSTHNYIICTH